MLEHSGKG